MSVVVALAEQTDSGLSEDDQRIATAILYARFRGVFSSVTRDSQDGPARLAVWKSNLDKRPVLTIDCQSDRYLALGEDGRTLAESPSIEGLLDALRPLFPPSPGL